MMKRYLSVWFPDWPLTRLRRKRFALNTLRTRADGPETRLPFVLTEAGPSGLVVAAANHRAQTLGISPGLGFTDARARAPKLHAEEIDRTADAEALDRLAHWMIRFTPLIAIDGVDAVMLETTGCAHLHGGEAAMMANIATMLEQNALPHQMGLAGTAGAASALARATPGKALEEGGEEAGLAGLPVTALRLSSDAVQLLKRFGLTRIGQLYGIDRKALARRFQSKAAAESVLMRLDQALGLRHEPLDPLRPAPLKSARLACPEPIATSEAIRIGLQQLVADLCGDLTAWGQGAREFVLHAFRADGTRSSVSVRTAQPVRTAKHIIRLFGERIDTIDPGFGIDLLMLEAHRTGLMETSAAALSGDLAASDTDDVALSALADRITARLGSGAVQIARPQESHIPEVAEPRIAFEGAIPDKPASSRQAGPRPIRIFERPERIRVLAEVPDGPPLHFVWRRVTRRVVRADGPERISPEWWKHSSAPPPATSPKGAERKWLAPKLDKRADANLIAEAREALSREDPGEPIYPLSRARDYYRVEDETGRRYWLFRDGLYGDGRGGAPDWYMQGLFA